MKQQIIIVTDHKTKCPFCGSESKIYLSGGKDEEDLVTRCKHTIAMWSLVTPSNKRAILFELE